MEELKDKNVHILGAFQLAGFPHVIGTMWRVEDATAAQISSLFYNIVLKNGELRPSESAIALHKAVRQVRSDQGGKLNPFFWAAFVHAGP